MYGQPFLESADYDNIQFGFCILLGRYATSLSGTARSYSAASYMNAYPRRSRVHVIYCLWFLWQAQFLRSISLFPLVNLFAYVRIYMRWQKRVLGPALKAIISLISGKPPISSFLCSLRV